MPLLASASIRGPPSGASPSPCEVWVWVTRISDIDHHASCIVGSRFLLSRSMEMVLYTVPLTHPATWEGLCLDGRGHAIRRRTRLQASSLSPDAHCRGSQIYFVLSQYTMLFVTPTVSSCPRYSEEHPCAVKYSCSLLLMGCTACQARFTDRLG